MKCAAVNILCGDRYHQGPLAEHGECRGGWCAGSGNSNQLGKADFVACRIQGKQAVGLQQSMLANDEVYEQPFRLTVS